MVDDLIKFGNENNSSDRSILKTGTLIRRVFGRNAVEKNLEKTEKAYLETKKESEEIAERLTGAANIISELKSALVHAMREQHDDDKFEDDVTNSFLMIILKSVPNIEFQNMF